MAKRVKTLKTFEFPVERDGVTIGYVLYNREDGYSVRADDYFDTGFASKDEAELTLREQASQAWEITRIVDPAYTIALDLNAGDFVVTFADGRAELRGARCYSDAEQAAQKELGR